MSITVIRELVKLAEKLDNEGNIEEAAQLFATAEKMADDEEAEGKEPKSRELSGKAKAKLRTIYKAANSFVQADLDCRGPHKKACMKVEDFCEQICELLKDMDFIKE